MTAILNNYLYKGGSWIIGPTKRVSTVYLGLAQRHFLYIEFFNKTDFDKAKLITGFEEFSGQYRLRVRIDKNQKTYIELLFDPKYVEGHNTAIAIKNLMR